MPTIDDYELVSSWSEVDAAAQGYGSGIQEGRLSSAVREKLNASQVPSGGWPENALADVVQNKLLPASGWPESSLAEAVRAKLNATEKPADGWTENDLDAAARAKLTAADNLAGRIDGIVSLQPDRTLTSSAFTQGYWSGASITVRNNYICTQTKFTVNAGDWLSIDEAGLQAKIFLYENGDTSQSATALYDYADTKPALVQLQTGGLMYIHLKRSNSANLTPSDFTGSIKIIGPMVERVTDIASTVERLRTMAPRRTLTAADFQTGYWSGGTIHSSNSRLCTKLLIPVEAGELISIDPDELQCTVYLNNGSTTTQILAYEDAVPAFLKITAAGSIFIQFKRADGTNLNTSAYTKSIVFYDPLIGKVLEQDARIDELAEGGQSSGENTTLRELNLGVFVQGGLASNGIDSSTSRICMKSCLALPYGVASKLKVHINPDYKISLRVGPYPHNLMTSKGFSTNGSTISFADADRASYFRVAIANAADTSAAISVSEMEDIDLHIYYEDISPGFEAYAPQINALKLQYQTVDGYSRHYPTRFTIAHMSDIHADAVRLERFIRFCEQYKVDLAVITGDITGYSTTVAGTGTEESNTFEWLHGLIQGTSVPFALCVGNHDSYVSDSTPYTLSDADTYTKLFQPIATELGNATGKVWYYRDFSGPKLRVISLDVYQQGPTSFAVYMTQEQITWFCQTLASTPAGYGVIVLQHVQLSAIAADSEYQKFATSATYSFSGVNPYDSDNDPIADIINAFSKRTTLAKDYKKSGTTQISVDADFSEVPADAEFIAALSGHVHNDHVGHVQRPSGDPMQLCLNIACGCSVYGGAGYRHLAGGCDTPRVQTDCTQDLFNVYSVNRTKKTVSMMRVGGQIAEDMRPRDYMSIPYAEVVT